MDALFAFQQQCIDNHNVCKVLRMTCGRISQSARTED